MKKSLGDRMKKYESVSKSYLTNRTPVIIRLDGKAFHTFTKHCKRPYDTLLHDAMVKTALYLVENIQGAVFAYTQSDEISVIIRDWDKLETEPWYDNQIQKIVSISASMATARFNQCYDHPNENLAMFDSRVFNLPKEEVHNYMVWRQQDAERNSIQMLGQAHFSHRQLQKKSCPQIKDMLMCMLDEPVNWNSQPTWTKRGCGIARYEGVRNVIVENEIPIFTKDPMFIQKFIIDGA